MSDKPGVHGRGAEKVWGRGGSGEVGERRPGQKQDPPVTHGFDEHGTKGQKQGSFVDQQSVTFQKFEGVTIPPINKDTTLVPGRPLQLPRTPAPDGQQQPHMVKQQTTSYFHKEEGLYPSLSYLKDEGQSSSPSSSAGQTKQTIQGMASSVQGAQGDDFDSPQKDQMRDNSVCIRLGQQIHQYNTNLGVLLSWIQSSTDTINVKDHCMGGKEAYCELISEICKECKEKKADMFELEELFKHIKQLAVNEREITNDYRKQQFTKLQVVKEYTGQSCSIDVGEHVLWKEDRGSNWCTVQRNDGKECTIPWAKLKFKETITVLLSESTATETKVKREKQMAELDATHRKLMYGFEKVCKDVQLKEKQLAREKKLLVFKKQCANFMSMTRMKNIQDIEKHDRAIQNSFDEIQQRAKIQLESSNSENSHAIKQHLQEAEDSINEWRRKKAYVKQNQIDQANGSAGGNPQAASGQQQGGMNTGGMYPGLGPLQYPEHSSNQTDTGGINHQFGAFGQQQNMGQGHINSTPCVTGSQAVQQHGTQLQPTHSSTRQQEHQFEASGGHGAKTFKRAWETFKFKAATFEFETSLYLTPCVVQFCLEKKKSYTWDALRTTQIKIVNVPVTDGTAICTVNIPKWNRSYEELQEYVLNHFISLTKEFDFVEIEIGTPQYTGVVAGLMEDLQVYVQNNKLDIYNSSSGLYVVGEKHVVHSVKEHLFPGTAIHSDDLQVGTDQEQAARRKEEKEEESKRQILAKNIHEECEKLEGWIQEERLVLELKDPENQHSCKQLLAKLGEVQHVGKKLDMDVCNLEETIQKVMIHVEVDQSQQQTWAQADQDLKSSEVRLGKLKQTLENFLKELKEHQKHLQQCLEYYIFLADCDKLEAMIDDKQGVSLLTVGDKFALQSKIDAAADKFQHTEFGDITEPRHKDLMKKIELKKEMQYHSKKAGDSSGSAHMKQSKKSEIAMAWGSVQLYIELQTGNADQNWTLDTTKYLDPLKMQFVIENNEVFEFSKPTIQGRVSLQKSYILCQVCCSESRTEAVVENRIIEALNDELSVFERHCIAKSSNIYRELQCTQSHEILTSKNQNHVEIFKWKEQLYVVGKQECIEKFFSDLGISYDTVCREQLEGLESKKVYENASTSGGDREPNYTGTDRTEKANSSNGKQTYSEMHHEPVDDPAQTHGDSEMLQRSVQAKYFSQNPQTKPNSISEKTSEADEMENIKREADISQPQENAKGPMAKAEAKEQIAEADINEQVAKTDVNIKKAEINANERMNAAKDNTAFRTDVDQQILNKFGYICIRSSSKSKPVWEKTSDFFDPYSFYFGWTTSGDYFVDKLTEKNVKIDVYGSNGIECSLIDSSQESTETLSCIGKVIHDVLLSDYESLTIENGTREEEAFTRMLQDGIPGAIASEDVIVFSDRDADCLCMVGFKEDVRQLKDELQEHIKRFDITKTAIKDGYENEFFTIKAPEGTTGLPQDIQCCVLQYHFTGIKRRNRAARLLKDLGIETEFTDQNCCLTISSATGMKCATETVVKAVIDKLVPSLKIVKFDTMSTEAIKLLNFLKEKTPPDVKHGIVEVYYYASTSTICVIGKEQQFTEFLTSVGLPLSTMQEKKDAIQKTPMKTVHADIAPAHGTTGATTEKETINSNDKQKLRYGEFHKTEPQRQPRSSEFNCSKEEFVWLQDLNFQQYFDHMEISNYVDINLTKFPGTITGDSLYVERVQAGAATFLKRTEQEKVIFNHKLCQQLLITGDGAINQTVVQFLKDTVRCCSKKMKHTEPIAFCLNVLPTGEVTVTCRDKPSCSAVSNILSTCIIHHIICADLAKSFSSHLKSDWKNKLKTTIEGKHLIIVCIEDISKDVLAIIEKLVAMTKTLDLHPMIVEYLNTYGEKILSEASNAIKARIEVIPDFGLKIYGSDDQLKTLNSILKTTIPDLRRSIKVDLPEKEIQKCQVEVDDKAAKYNCCWKLQSTFKVSKQLQLQNCTYVAKWFDPLRALQMTVVQGIAEDISFDALVYLTNDSLFPQDECQTDMHYLLKRAKKDFPEAVSEAVNNKGDFSLGDIYTYPTVLNGIQAKSVSSIVVVSAKQSKKLSYRDLSHRISEALSRLSSTKRVTIAFKASALTQYMGVEQMVEAICEGYKHFCMNTNATKVQLYLCCFGETVKNVTKQVNKCFKHQLGLGRKVFDASSIGFEIHGNKIMMTAEMNSILCAKVDVIVNTVATDLDLEQGLVSKQILTEAGHDIQKECRRICPNGISFWDIVTTKAYLIRRMKHVIHGAVAGYQPQTFQDHVKQFVKKCLYEAERLPGCNKIAFPALGVGKLGYPRRETACAMFDAFEEFQSEVIKPTITEIKLMLHSGDNPTCQVFSAEEWRRSKKCDTVPKPVIKESVKYLKQEVFESGAVDVIVALTEDIKRNPYAVEVIFEQNSKAAVRLKNATKKPETWNDQLYVEVKEKSANALRDAMSKCLQCCEKDRITEIIIDSSQVLMSMSLQLQIMTEQIKQYRKHKYLRTVYVTVNDAGYADIQGGDRNRVWKEIQIDPRNQCKTTIELIGENAAKLDDAEKAIKDVLQKVKENLKPVSLDLIQKSSGSMSTSMKGGDGGARPKDASTAAHTSASMKGGDGGARPKDTNTAAHTSASMKGEDGGARPKDTNTAAQVAPPSPAAPHVTGQPSSTDEGFNEDDLYDELFSCVSAIINPGIISFLEERAKLQAWINKVKQAVKVHILKLEDGTYKVEGSFRAISEFQDYLDNKFPSDPDKSINEEEDMDENDAAYLPPEDVIERYPYNPDKTMKYMFDNVVVKLCKGNLTRIKADCIAMSNQPTLVSRYGIAKHIAQAAGEEFQRECRQSVANNRELKVSDCRITAHGLLRNCKKVAHVYTPRCVKKRDLNQKLLDELEKALLNCYTEVDRIQMETLAMPFIGSGSSGFDPAICAQQHVRALNKFFKKVSKIREVIFVDLKGEGLQVLHNELLKNQPKQVQCLELPFVEDFCSKENPTGTSVDRMHGSGKMTVRQRSKFGSNYWLLKKFKNDVKIYVTYMDITAVVVDAVVSPEDSSFRGDGAIAKKLIDLGGDQYRETRSKLQKALSIQVTDVKDGDLVRICRYVLHVPPWNRMYTTNAGQLENNIQKTVEEILQTAENYGLMSVAIPLLGTADKKEKMHTPVETCCRAMINGIQNYFSKLVNRNTLLERIEICCIDSAVERAFMDYLGSKAEDWKCCPYPVQETMV